MGALIYDPVAVDCEQKRVAMKIVHGYYPRIQLFWCTRNKIHNKRENFTEQNELTASVHLIRAVRAAKRQNSAPVFH